MLLAGLVFIFSDPLSRILNLPESSGSGLIRIAALGLFATCLSGIPITVLNALHRFPAMVASTFVKSGLNALLIGALFLGGQLSVRTALWVGIITAAAAAWLSTSLLSSPWRRAL